MDTQEIAINLSNISKIIYLKLDLSRIYLHLDIREAILAYESKPSEDLEIHRYPT